MKDGLNFVCDTSGDGLVAPELPDTEKGDGGDGVETSVCLDSGSKDSGSEGKVGTDGEEGQAEQRAVPDRSLFRDDFKFPTHRTCMQLTLGPSTMLPMGILAEHAKSYDSCVSEPKVTMGRHIDDLFRVKLPIEMIHMGVRWVDKLPEDVIP